MHNMLQNSQKKRKKKRRWGGIYKGKKRKRKLWMWKLVKVHKRKGFVLVSEINFVIQISRITHNRIFKKLNALSKLKK